MENASSVMEKAITRMQWEFWCPLLFFTALLLLLWIFLPCYHFRHRSDKKKTFKPLQAYLAAATLTAIIVPAISFLLCGTAKEIEMAKRDLENERYESFTGEFWISDNYHQMDLEFYDKWATVEISNADGSTEFLTLYVDGIAHEWSLDYGRHNGTVVYAVESGIVICFVDNQ